MWQETGVKPPALTNRPELDGIWSWPHSVWVELTGSRQQGMSSSSDIAFSEVYLYGKVHGCNDSEVADLWHDVHRMDKAWSVEVSKIKEAQSG